jgi:glycosyltransferase involved in cell wall biosynthesis
MSQISIIIPSFNTAHYLCEAVDSVLNSTFKDFEIIIVDDGSTDNTKQVVSKYNNTPSVNYIYQSNKGLAGARNTGISAAQGKYLVFLDSDDVILSDKLEVQFNYLENNKDIDVVYSLSECFVENDLNDRIKINFPIFEGNVLPQLLNGNFMHVNSIMVRKEKVVAVGCFNSNYRELEDWDLWLRMSIEGSKFKCISHVLSLVRVRRDSMTANQDKMNKSMFNVLLNFKTFMEPSSYWGSYKVNYYKSLLQFAVLSNSPNFIGVLKETMKVGGIATWTYAIKQMMKKYLNYNKLKGNHTTANLKKVWNNER